MEVMGTISNVLIVMDAAQTVAVCRAAQSSVVIATHMDSEDHATVSRQALRAYAEENGIRAKQLLIPADGEILTGIIGPKNWTTC